MVSNGIVIVAIVCPNCGYNIKLSYAKEELLKKKSSVQKYIQYFVVALFVIFIISTVTTRIQREKEREENKIYLEDKEVFSDCEAYISTIHYGVEEYFKAEDNTSDENSIVIQKTRGKYDITYGLYGLSENYDDKRLSADSKSNLKVEIWKGFDKKEKELILECVEEAEKNIDNVKSLFSY